MTIICIKDGIIAADTLMTANENQVGGHKCKIVAVPDDYGGGYAAGCGGYFQVWTAIKCLIEGTNPPKVESYAIWHLRKDGTIWCSSDGSDYIEEPYFTHYADGSASDFARGAMASGKSAEEAVILCGQYVNGIAGCDVRSINE